MNVLSRLALLLALILTRAAVAEQTVAPPAGPQSAHFSLITDRAPLTPLVGKWRFHPGDDPRWADPAFDDTGWDLLRSDLSWNRQGYPALTGFAWYRFSVELPADTRTYSLVLPYITSSYQVFLDGHLAATIGQPGKGNEDWDEPSSVIGLPRKGGASCCTIEVALRVWRAPNGLSSGGPRTALYSLVADSRLAQKQVEAANLSVWTPLVPTLVVAVVYLLAGLICLALFLQSGRDKEYVWFSLYALLAAVGSSIDFFTRNHVVNSERINDLENLLLFGAAATLVVFYRQITHARSSILYWLALLGALAVAPWQVFTELVNRDGWRDLAAPLLVLPFPIWVLATFRESKTGRNEYPFVTAVPVLLWVAITEYGYCTGLFPRFQLPRYLPVGPFYLDSVDLADFLLLITMLMVLVTRFARSRQEQYAVEIELRRARSVQQILVPDALQVIPEYQVEAAYLPASEVSGDFFQVLRVPGEDLVIVVGDAAGKGMAAALTVSVLVGAIKALVDRVNGPATLLAALNKVLAEQNIGLTTCLALRFSPTGHVRFACAGHPSPYVNGREVLAEGNLPLGIAESEPMNEGSLQLCPGDQLMLITDGIPEAMDKKNVLFGWERTLELSRQSAHEIALAAQEYGQTDDITAVSVVFNGRS